MKTYKSYKRRMENELPHYDNQDDFVDEAMHIFITEKEGELKRDYYLSEIREKMHRMWNNYLEEQDKQNKLNL